MKRFEYKTIEVLTSGFFAKMEMKETDDTLNDLGSQGWELVSTVPCITGSTTQRIYYTFKREI